MVQVEATILAGPRSNLAAFLKALKRLEASNHFLEKHRCTADQDLRFFACMVAAALTKIHARMHSTALRCSEHTMEGTNPANMHKIEKSTKDMSLGPSTEVAACLVLGKFCPGNHLELSSWSCRDPE